MILDKLKQEVDLGDWVIVARPRYHDDLLCKRVERIGNTGVSVHIDGKITHRSNFIKIDPPPTSISFLALSKGCEVDPGEDTVDEFGYV